MAKPVIALNDLKEHLGVSHTLDDPLIDRFGRAAVDTCLAELGWSEEPNEEEPCEWADQLAPVPEWFSIAVSFLVTHWYENRSAVVVGSGIAAMALPLSVERILALHRSHHFR